MTEKNKNSNKSKKVKNSPCGDCGIEYKPVELYELLGQDYGLCTNCLKNSMREGKFPALTEEQLIKITTMLLKDLPYEIDGVELTSYEDNRDFNNSNFLDSYSNYEDYTPNTVDYYTEQENERLESINFGRDLNELVKNDTITGVTGREKELEEMMIVLSRKFKSNPLIVGEPGVGKTALVEGLAKRIVNGQVPEKLKNKVILEINAGSLVAGTRLRGEFEERVENILKEVREKKNIILFFDEFHSLVSAGGTDGTVDAIDILKPYIARGEVQIIGATTYDEYRKHVMIDGALSRRMQTIDIKEPTINETVQIINGLKESLEIHHKVKIDQEVISHAAKLSDRYLTERSQPDKTIDLLDETAAFVKISKADDNDDLQVLKDKLAEVVKLKDQFIIEDKLREAKEVLEKEMNLKKQLGEVEKKLEEESKKRIAVTTDKVNEILERRTGLPVAELVGNEREKISNLESKIKESIKGQDHAVREVSKFIKRSKLNLKDPNRPSGVFLFLGPTGVGKTELAKVISKEVFGTIKSMIRFDMSEYMEKNSANKLIGSPPGYVGHEEGGKLTNQLRRNPYTLILFDEVEKAHPDVMNVMLQLFEDGILTDSQGKTVDARNAIFILTSNAGSEVHYNSSLGFKVSEKNDDFNQNKEIETLDSIKSQKLFKPEFLNRIDSVLVFNQLTKESIAEIVDKLIKEFVDRLAGEGYKLKFTDGVKKIISEIGYNPEYGARELRRKVENVSDLISDAILETNRNTFKIIEENGKIKVK